MQTHHLLPKLLAVRIPPPLRLPLVLAVTAVALSDFARAQDSTTFPADEANVRELLRTGSYPEALAAAERSARFPDHPIQRALLLHHAMTPLRPRDRALGQLYAAVRNPTDLANATPDSLIALGRARLLLGDDPREIIRQCYDPAKAAAPKDPAPLIAIGDLALAKRDDHLAATHYRAALALLPANAPDPDVLARLARALSPTNPRATDDTLAAALTADPTNLPALQLQAETLIARDQFDEARAAIARILAVNPHHVAAHALTAAIAQLTGDSAAMAAARARALAPWPGSPEPDLLIGRTLAAQIRPAEAIEFLRLALRADPNNLETNFLLGSTLLRFGREPEGWPFIEATFDADPYHVAAFNLLELRDRTDRHTTLERDGIRLRMDPTQATVYGQRALDLLARARDTLTAKYRTAVPNPVTVEIYADQRDFAIRTFGVPGGEGFLGVCFGPLITASGPGTNLGRANWEAVLWHEFAHTVTLTHTHHRIPRWLSEGISVHEERRADPRWGFALTPRLRQAIVEDKIPPIDKLDAAFRTGDFPLAYYVSSLAVDYIVATHGFDSLRAVLDDLRARRPLAESLAARLAPLPDLRAGFTAYAKEITTAAGPNLDWTPLTESDQDAIVNNPDAWLQSHPTNYWGLTAHARHLVENADHTTARPLLERLVDLYPGNHDDPNPRALLATVYKHLDQPDRERRTLADLNALDAGNLPALHRQLELTTDPVETAKITEALLAIDPLNPLTHASRAANATLTPTQRDSAFTALLALGPPDEARTRYDYAQFLRPTDPERSRRQVLKALEQTPRYRAAQTLLLDLQK